MITFPIFNYFLVICFADVGKSIAQKHKASIECWQNVNLLND